MSQDEGQLSSLMPLVYDELRRIADRYMRHEKPGQTIQATGLVNEAYLRLAAERPREFANRTHFVAIAALSMRQILVQRARSRAALKRGGAPARLTLDDGMLVDEGRSVDLIALDEALTELSTFDAAQAKIVELRYFGGLTVEETAEAVGVSPATVKREWAMARAWLKRTLDPTAD